ncbi:site-specific integrase [Odoribacter sp. OttesenSCG-928-L07]|nr:site-specific integrase [Odoribacter sp. OttesenSCG-928-L07]
MYKIIDHCEGNINNKDVIFIQLESYVKMRELIKSFPGIKWSREYNSLYVPRNNHYLRLINIQQHDYTDETLSRIAEINRHALIDMSETLKMKAYSINTRRTYCNEFAQLLYLLKNEAVDELNSARLKKYILYCIDNLKLSENQVHSRYNAIKFYFEQVLKRDKIFINIPRPKKHLKLPKHISMQDIRRLFEVTTNIKHNTMLKLCYGMGLRVSEIVNLKISDIDSNNMQVLIERGKGKKDRYVNLPFSILEQLRIYYKEYRPKIYLFEGQYGGQYSIRSAQKVFKTSMQKAKINKDIGIHGLRHSYATHLLESGTDISMIQQLLGHNNIKTTLLYTKVSNTSLKNIKSPLDNI